MTDLVKDYNLKMRVSSKYEFNTHATRYTNAVCVKEVSLAIVFLILWTVLMNLSILLFEVIRLIKEWIQRKIREKVEKKYAINSEE